MMLQLPIRICQARILTRNLPNLGRGLNVLDILLGAMGMPGITLAELLTITRHIFYEIA